MVSATHWLAASTGMAMLERGGNAFDAAVAAGLVLQVVEPHLNGPGGEVPILAQKSSDETVFVVCGQGPLPAAASVKGARDLGLLQVPGTGLLPNCVPGAFGAWMLLLEQFGRLSLEEVLAPAIGYADCGFRLLPRAAMTIAASREIFRDHWTTSAEIYLTNGAVPQGGGMWRNPTLAATYQRVLNEAKHAGAQREAQIERARETFYSGFIAEAIDAFASSTLVMDDSGEAHRGFLTGDDLARWQPTLEDPLSINYHGKLVHKTGPWGQGPVFLQTLKLLEGFDLSSIDPSSAQFVHLVVEATKLAFADRDAFYGDPQHVGVPIEDLLSENYALERRKLISETASLVIRPGMPGGRHPWVIDPELVGIGHLSAGTGVPPDPIGRDTCHLDVVDREGNIVSATPSGGWLHGGPCVPGLGFSLSTRGQMCWLDDSSPSAYVGGRRPRTTLSPTLVLDGDRRAIAFGTPGGDQQDQWTLAFFLRHVHHNMDLQASIDAPAFHTSHFPSSFYPREAHLGRLNVEARFSDAIVQDLYDRGHDVVVDGEWSLGRVCAVAKNGSERMAASDARQDQAYSVGR